MAARRARGPAAEAGALALAALLLGACASHPAALHEQDGPPEHVPAGLDALPDAVPRIEPFNPYANRPYTALGRRFVPATGDEPFEQRGMASWYGRQYHGNRTASGEPYDMFAMTAAHPTLPIPSYARVTSTRDGRSVVVRINDRGPFILDRIIDLSYAAAVRLGLANPGSGEVVVHRLTAQEIAAWPAAAPAPLAQAAPAALPVPLPEAPVAVAMPVVVAGSGAAAPLALDGAPRAPAPPATERMPDPPGAPAAAARPVPTSAPSGAAAAAAQAPPLARDGAAPPGDAPAAPPAAPAHLPTWSVQLGAFAVAEHANRLRDELAQRLAGAAGADLPAEARIVRIEQTGALSRVLIGHVFDRANAQALARQLHLLLGRETSLFAR